LSGGVRYVVETRQRRRVAALFSQYVPDRVATQLIDEGRVASATAGERVVASAMFCDLRGFTELSAQLEPTQVNDVLTDFYEYSSAIVLDHDGTLMTYIGDEIFVIFGAPVPTADHAARAVACARALQERVSELDETLESHGFAPLRFGIGVNAGELVAVHAGSSRRRQYTAIGDTVNVASRLCGQAGPGQVVLSDATVRASAQDLPIEPLGPREMKGVPDDFVAWKLVLDRPPSGTRDR
jgi:adenylate cyclase